MVKCCIKQLIDMKFKNERFFAVEFSVSADKKLPLFCNTNCTNFLLGKNVMCNPWMHQETISILKDCLPFWFWFCLRLFFKVTQKIFAVLQWFYNAYYHIFPFQTQYLFKWRKQKSKYNQLQNLELSWHLKISTYDLWQSAKILHLCITQIPHFDDSIE